MGSPWFIYTIENLLSARQLKSYTAHFLIVKLRVYDDSRDYDGLHWHVKISNYGDTGLSTWWLWTNKQLTLPHAYLLMVAATFENGSTDRCEFSWT